ncbi:MAG: hypothetical protein LQ339_001940 [Xanthoria mediterranea]|nr:MAG: hypothetical protein LQ339_001940 [Xanthoria mediterranea]
MASFRIVEHTIPGQHVREYPHATRSGQDECLQLAVKQYVPGIVEEPGPEDVTIVTSHANGFPKETYEVFFEHLLQISKNHGFRIRSIIIADRSNHGASGVLNEKLQGDDPSWFDHPRDLLHILNVLRPPRPIVGVGHSMGATELINLSLIHPRLFTSLVLIEPIVMLGSLAGPNIAMPSTFRRDLWPTRSAAEEAFRKNRFFDSFHPEVLERYLKYGLRELPCCIYPTIRTNSEPRPVTLTTSKHQEVWTFARSNFSPPDPARDRLVNPNAVIGTPDEDLMFSRSECEVTFNKLPHVRPAVLYIHGSKSQFNGAEQIQAIQDHTGRGIGGNGGIETGQVQSHVFENAGHFLPFTHVEELAIVIGKYVGESVRRKMEQDAFWRDYDSQKSAVVSEKWIHEVKKPGDTKREVKGKL